MPRNTGVEKFQVRWSATIRSIPSGSARVSTTAIVCGWHARETKNARTEGCFRRAKHIAMPSAAAVASSSNEAFAISSPVRSVTIVWKFSSASSRPWAISAWYGV